MKYKTTYRRWGSLVLGLILTGGAYAQRADTLRRSLHVLTSEAVQLSTAQPLDYTLSLPRRELSRPIDTRPSPLALGTVGGLTPQALPSATPLPSLLPYSRQRGYVEGALGLMYNARLSAGLSLIDNERTRLSTDVGGRWTRAELRDLATQPIREDAYGVRASLQHRFAQARLDLSGSYTYDQHNYYGIYTLPLTPQIKQTTADKLTSPRLTSHQVDLRGHIYADSVRRDAWYWSIAPRLAFVSATPTPEVFGSVSEGLLGLNMQFGRHLSRSTYSYLGIEVDAAAQWGGDRRTMLAGGFRPASVISLSPYWCTEGELRMLDYSVELGGALITYRHEDGSLPLLTPRISAHIGRAESWRLKLDLKGDVRPNYLGDLLAEMPYLDLSDDIPLATRRPLQARLGLQVHPRADLGLELGVDYQYLRDAINYYGAPYGVYKPFDQSVGLTAEPYTASYHIQQVDGHLTSLYVGGAWRYASTWDLKADVRYNILSQTLTSRPKAELNLDWQYHPYERWHVALGYTLLSGIEYTYLDLRTLGSSLAIVPVREEQPALHQVRLSGAYRLAPRWTIGGVASLSLTGRGTRYWAYPPQRFAAEVNLTYRF